MLKPSTEKKHLARLKFMLTHLRRETTALHKLASAADNQKKPMTPPDTTKR